MSYSSAELQFVYSTAPADGAVLSVQFKNSFFFQIVQFSISMQIKCQNNSILNNSFGINMQFKYKNSKL